MTDSAVVSGDATFGSPTGTVTFYECGATATPQGCTSTANQVGDVITVTPAGDDLTSTATTDTSFTPTSTGYWCFGAVYSGDSNYAGSSDQSTDECVDVTGLSTSTTSSPESTTIVLGSSNTDTATVTGNETTGSPTGSVTFYECGSTSTPQPCTSTSNQVGNPVTVTANGDGVSSSASSASFTPTSTGYWCFGAVYSGDSNYAGSSDQSTDECFDVTPASTSTTSTPTSSTISLGHSDTDKATVTGNAAGGSPGGSVTFYECGSTSTPQPCTSTSNQVGSPVTVTGGANDTSTATSSSFTPTSLGYWCFAAVYSGNSNYTGSSDTTTDECVDVTQGTTTTVSQVSNSTITLGQTVNDMATVTGNAVGGSPTGTVSFYACGPYTARTACTSTSQEIGGPLNLTSESGNKAITNSIPFTPANVGYWCLAAVYSGSSTYLGSADQTTDECFFVQGPVVITTTSLPNGTVGQPYSAQLAAQGGTPPYTWNHRGYRLPRGLKLNAETGQITGTPASRDTGTYTIVFGVADSNRPAEHATKSLTIRIFT